MTILLYILLFFLGASIGSFYYNVSERILLYFYSPLRKNFSFIEKLTRLLLQKNQCSSCAHPLKLYQALPLAGYFLSRGKCQHCHNKIPILHPVIELAFGFTLLFLFIISQNILLSASVSFLFGHLLISAITDYRYFSLDYENLFFIILSGLVVIYQLDSFLQFSHFLVLAGFFAVYLALWIFFKKSIGFGDVLFAPFYAFISGHPWWILFLNSSYVLAVFSTLLLRKKGESLKNRVIPMGVYLSAGLYLTLLAKIYFIYRV